jgi:hypothetical protein
MMVLPSRPRWRSIGLGLAIAFATGGAALAADRVFIEVGCILASEGGQHYDEKIELLRGRLEKMFHYASYRLVKHENRGVAWGDPIAFEMPGGHSLEIRPMERRADQVALKLALKQDREVLLQTDFLLGRHGRVILGGPRLDNGVLLFWVEARTKRGPGAPTPVAGSDEEPLR